MGDSLHCDFCGKPATVHLTKIIKNQIQKVDLCEECAQTKGVTDPEGSSLAELLAKSFVATGGIESGVPDPAGLTCEQCGCSSRDFKKSGRLGCALCYTNLRAIVLPLISGLHKGQQHLGKAPARQFRIVGLRRKIENVERQLQEAVQGENFENAARCRDELGTLRAQLDSPAPNP